jgi:hypothetical protein
MMPRMAKAEKGPDDATRLRATNAVTNAPPPKPATAMPVIKPRLSGNHLMSVATGTM